MVKASPRARVIIGTIIAAAALPLVISTASAQANWVPVSEPRPAIETTPQYQTMIVTANEAFETFHLGKPYPTIEVVPLGSDEIGGARARAVYRGFRDRVIYVNQYSLLMEPWHTGAAIAHETAHLATWEHHGFGVEWHGPEFQEMCMSGGDETVCHPWACSDPDR